MGAVSQMVPILVAVGLTVGCCPRSDARRNPNWGCECTGPGGEVRVVPGALCDDDIKPPDGTVGLLEYRTNRAGFDYATFPLPSGGAEQCRDECVEDHLCLAFTFTYADENGSPAQCSLKNAIPGASTSESAVSGVVRFGVELGVDRTGSDISTLTGRSADECLDECIARDGCHAFTHVQEGGTCFLKNPAPGPVLGGPGVSSGLVRVSGFELGVERLGETYSETELSEPSPVGCVVACESDDRCLSFTYFQPGYRAESAVCALKDARPEGTVLTEAISGIVR